MKKIILANKPVGITPFELIQKLKEEYKEYKDSKISYAGRLDPMAEGLMVFLIGEENKKRKEYEKLVKEYDFEVLFGIMTDSYDVMGIVEKVVPVSLKEIQESIQPLISSFVESYEQSYPPYSSMSVKGKPLFWWAKRGKIDEIDIPKKQVEIYSLALKYSYTLSIKEIYENSKKRIEQVTGDFRQKEILKRWEEVIFKNSKMIFPIFKFHIACSSGTYVRALANDIGMKLGTGAIAFQIIRTKTGNFSLDNKQINVFI